MSAWAKRAEKWKPPTLRETVDLMAENIQEAARNEQDARLAVEQYPPGDPRLVKAQSDVLRYSGDQPHWRWYLAFYRELLQRFPELADKPADVAVKKSRERPPVTRHLQPLPDDSDIPF